MFIEAPRLLNLNLEPLAFLLNLTKATKRAIASLLVNKNKHQVNIQRLLKARLIFQTTPCRNIVNFPRHRLKIKLVSVLEQTRRVEFVYLPVQSEEIVI